MLSVIEASKNQRLEIERKADKDKSDADLAERREDNLRELEAIRDLEVRRQAEFKQRMDQLELMHQQRMDQLAQKVELMKNDQDNRQDQLTELLKNHDDNKTQVIVEQIRQSLAAEKPQKLEDDKSYINELQGLIKSVQEAQTENKLGMIMEGLQTAIASARAPRRNTPVRDEEGNLVASISSIDEIDE
jgi:exonuclease VII large subunit